MDRIIFLDIDGVLNTSSQRDRFGHDVLDPVLIDIFMSVVVDTGAKIVVHSGWRLGHVILDSFKDSFRKCLELNGAKNIDRFLDSIIDTTLDLPGGKSQEIREWVDAHDFTGKFVVIDDDLIAIDNQVKTQDRRGITKDHANQMISILIGE